MALFGAVAAAAAVLAVAAPRSRPAPLAEPLPEAAVAVAPAIADAPSIPREYYASPEGRDVNDGSRERPLALSFALSEKSPLRPGDTLWLLGGVYRGTFTSVLTGSERAPIVVSQPPGERAVLDSAPSPDAALKVKGRWTWFRGFEVRNSDGHRRSAQPGVWPTDLRRGPGVTAMGEYLKFINLVIHDSTSGITVEPESVETEVYGNLIFNNGWQGPDAPQGHGIVTQNERGIRRIADNVVFNQFGDGIHAYGSALDDIHLEGNIVFGNGALSTSGGERNILLGGGAVAHRPVVTGNYTYFARGADGAGENNLGYSAGCSGLTARGNYWIGGNPLNLIKCDESTITDNVLVGRIQPELPARFPQNQYLASAPGETRVFIRPNQYEKGRAHIVVYNWSGQERIAIDLRDAGLPPGAAFEIRDVQDLFAKPLAAGTVGAAPLSIDVSGLTIAAPVGDVPAAARHTAPEFVTLLVTSTSRQSRPVATN